MRIFAVYAKVRLTQKPDWLDDFCAEYNPSSDYHVTLKQPCFIELGEIRNVKRILSDFFTKLKVLEHKIELTFSKLVTDTESNGERTIMINAEYSPAINQLQKTIVSALDPYGNYVRKESREWEDNFVPHITIASDIDAVQYTSARKKLKPDHRCEGFIEEIVLAIAKQGTSEKTKTVEGQTIYHL